MPHPLATNNTSSVFCLSIVSHKKNTRLSRPKTFTFPSCFPDFQQEDAEKLYKCCQRFDLLNNFYQASGQWQQALETAENRDRIHLRTTYYNYAKYLESMGDKTHALT